MGILNNLNSLEGYIANDIVVKENNNRKYATFILTVKDHYYDENNKFVKRYQRVPFIAYRKLAERMEQYIVKGQRTIIQFKVVSHKNEQEHLNVSLIVINFETLESHDAVYSRQQRKEEQQVDDAKDKEQQELDKPVDNTVIEATESLTINSTRDYMEDGLGY